MELVSRISDITTVERKGNWINPTAKALLLESFAPTPKRKEQIEAQIDAWAKANSFAVLWVTKNDALMADKRGGINQLISEDLAQADDILNEDFRGRPQINIGFSFGGGALNEYMIVNQARCDLFVWSSAVLNSAPAWDAQKTALLASDSGVSLGHETNYETLGVMHDHTLAFAPTQPTHIQLEKYDSRNQLGFIDEYLAHHKGADVTFKRLDAGKHACFIGEVTEDVAKNVSDRVGIACVGIR